MVFNIFTTCVVGFIFLLILLLNTSDDIDSIINTDYGNSAIAVFVDSVGLNKAIPLTALIVIIAYMAGLANMTITARIGWAMARDGAFPYSPWLHKINPVTKSPVNMIIVILIFDYILLLIPLGSELAFTALGSISTIGYQASYAIPIVLRLTTGIFESDPSFSLGIFSKPLHMLSAAFLSVTGFFMFLPSSNPIAIDGFQWSIVIAPAFTVIGGIYWFAYARAALEGSGDTEEKDAAKEVTVMEEIEC